MKNASQEPPSESPNDYKAAKWLVFVFLSLPGPMLCVVRGFKSFAVSPTPIERTGTDQGAAAALRRGNEALERARKLLERARKLLEEVERGNSSAETREVEGEK